MATTKITTREARNNLADLINEVAYGKNRFVLTRRGKSLVAIVSLEDLELLEKAEAEHNPGGEK